MATRTHIEGACLAAAVALLCAAGSAEAQIVIGAQFGFDLARCDYNRDGYEDLAIAANEAWDGTVHGGKVFVLYGGSGGLGKAGRQSFSQSDLPTGFPAEDYAWFGFALAGGDFNGDGYCDLTITASWQLVGTVSGGIVNVVYGSAQGLSLSPSSTGTPEVNSGVPPFARSLRDRGPGTVLPPRTFTQRDLGDDVETGDQLGTAAAAADFNGDGYADLAVSAAGETVDGKANAGVVHVIYGSAVGLRTAGPAPVTLTQRTDDGPKEVEAWDYFGANLTAGDFDGDGYADLAAGAPWELDADVGASGRVTIFYGAAGGLAADPRRSRQIDEGTLEGAGQRGNHYFASALTSGDFNGDGYRDLAIGTSVDVDVNGVLGGAVHVVFGSRKGLTRRFQHLGQDMPADIADEAEELDLFGNALAAGDFNDDGIADLAVGATGEDDAGGQGRPQGMAHIIYGSRLGLTSAANEVVKGYPSEISGSEFAFRLAAGDFNGDGRADLAIGCPGANSAAGEPYVGTVKVVYPRRDGRRELWWWPW